MRVRFMRERTHTHKYNCSEFSSQKISFYNFLTFKNLYVIIYDRTYNEEIYYHNIMVNYCKYFILYERNDVSLSSLCDAISISFELSFFNSNENDFDNLYNK